MICTVTSSLIGQSVIKRFCAPAWIKPLRKPMTPSPARACPEPVSQAERVTNQVPCRSKVLTSSAVTIPSFPTGGTSSRFQASIVVCAPAKAKPLRCIGFLKNLDLVTLCLSFNDASGSVWVEVGSSLAKNPWVARCRIYGEWILSSVSFVASLAVKSLGVQLQSANFLTSSSLSFCVPSKLPKLQSSISLFSLPRTEPASAERLSALANIAVEARSKAGLANRTTSLEV